MKLLSQDPSNYDDAPREGIRRILVQYYKEHGELEKLSQIEREGKVITKDIEWIRMGTTIATNALLERNGEKFVFVTTKGFKDILKIGNQSRTHIFDLQMRKVVPLHDIVLEIDERVRILSSKDAELYSNSSIFSFTPKQQ